MKTGIIGLPQVGKTSLFVMLTKLSVAQRSGNPREAHLGVTKVPDDRLDRLAALYNPKKLVHASVEYADVAALSQEALKETAFAANLRNVDALAHVVRAFDDPSIRTWAPSIRCATSRTSTSTSSSTISARWRSAWSAWKKT